MVADIAICGAGVAGCALAIALARAGYSVLLLEREVTPARQPGESLPPEVRVPLAALGVWEGFLADGHRPALGNRAVWGADVDWGKDFLFNPYGNGWHIDRYRFDVMLQRAAEAAGVVMHRGINRTETAREDFLWRVSWRDRSGSYTAMARFVADATGRARGLARRLGVAVRRYDGRAAQGRAARQPRHRHKSPQPSKLKTPAGKAGVFCGRARGKNLIVRKTSNSITQ